MIDLFNKKIIKDEIIEAIPYMGSKRKLATKIINKIYETVGNFDNFYDLFGGGASVSLASLKTGYKTYYNELNAGIANLFKHIVNGGELPKKWISREEFKKLKNGDDWYSGFLKSVWSFGNNQEYYLFGKDVENYKKAFHYIVVYNDFSLFDKLKNDIDFVKQLNSYSIDNIELFMNMYKTQFQIGKGRVEHMRVIKYIQKNYLNNRFPTLIKETLQQLGRLQQLEQLQRLQRLKRLQKLKETQLIQKPEQLEISILSYDSIEIKPKSVVYCDPPYFGTRKYQMKNFDYNKFYLWCKNNPNPVFISEYQMPEYFKEIASFNHRTTLCPTKNNKVIEKLYWNGKGLRNF